MAETRPITREMIEAAAAAIANARGGRRGAPQIRNILRILPEKLLDEVLEDAEVALKAALTPSEA
ncbi:hypothetical protein [uncultured Variovorax sp.]|uniref:hypothetical protein n=1 Tax=uncultured Variovorax sp. TaxID=114708 RepID=UPI0026184635|nr:hypothetical protein [uncultured Variovorax sp.]